MTQHRETLRYTVQNRSRFHPVLSRAISEADGYYERKWASEAHLKALSITATGGTQWACGSCGEHKKQTAFVAALMDISDTDLKIALRRHRPEGGHNELKIRLIPDLKPAALDLISNEHVDKSFFVFLMSGVGFWSAPLIHVVAGADGWRTKHELDGWLMYPDTQACWVAQKFDPIMKAAGGDFGKAARAWAQFCFFENPDDWAFRAVGVFNRLLKDGHCVEL